jgi:hypothetical protein
LLAEVLVVVLARGGSRCSWRLVLSPRRVVVLAVVALCGRVALPVALPFARVVAALCVLVDRAIRCVGDVSGLNAGLGVKVTG